jgi:5-methyltetrahydropteroyltriglutamate--homocysteine methyltransferase
MRRSENRILTTHAGSLPRPRALLELHARRARGETVDPVAFETEAGGAVRDVIARQIAAGIDIGNDGEQRRVTFSRYMQERLSGLGGSWERPPRADVEDFPLYKAMSRERSSRAALAAPDTLPQARAEIRHVNAGAVERECSAFLEALRQAPGQFVEAFVTAPSPGFLATTMQNVHYASQEAYLAALGEALRVEYEAIARQGLVLQIDCPDFGVEPGRLFYRRPRSEFLDFLGKTVETINQAVRNIPREQIRLHVCWGNADSPRVHDIPLAEILPTILGAKVSAIMFPFANGRHAHEFQLLRRIPLAEDQIVLAGVIDTLTNVVEHPEVVADRLERVAAAVGDPRRVIASTDCGLETSAGASRVAGDVAWAKLAALAEGARIASARLFPARAA